MYSPQDPWMKAKEVLLPCVTFPSLYFLTELEHLNATSSPEVNALHPEVPQEHFLGFFSVPNCLLDAPLGLSTSTAEESSGQYSVPPSRHPRRAGSCVPSTHTLWGCPLHTGTGLEDGWDAQAPPAGHTFNRPGGWEVCGSEVLVPVPHWV